MHGNQQLSTLRIQDIDTTIKPLYGKQDGAQVSYNPHKPGRPSHALHTYWVGNLRLVLDVVVSPGKEHSAGKMRPGPSDQGWGAVENTLKLSRDGLHKSATRTAQTLNVDETRERYLHQIRDCDQKVA